MKNENNLANPRTLGLATFVISQSLLNLPNAHLVPALITPFFLPVILVCGGFTQLLCGIFEFVRGHRFGTAMYGLYGGFFISLGLFVYFELTGVLKFGAASQVALGTFLLAWGIITIPFMLASFRESKLLGYLFFFVDLAFLGAALSNLAGIDSAYGGWAGLISAVIGLYMVYKGLIEDTEHNHVYIEGHHNTVGVIE
jgi:uncharacterized protein